MGNENINEALDDMATAGDIKTEIKNGEFSFSLTNLGKEDALKLLKTNSAARALFFKILICHKVPIEKIIKTWKELGIDFEVDLYDWMVGGLKP